MTDRQRPGEGWRKLTNSSRQSHKVFPSQHTSSHQHQRGISFKCTAQANW